MTPPVSVLDKSAYDELAEAQRKHKETQDFWLRKRVKILSTCEEVDERGELTPEAVEMRAAVIASCKADPMFFFHIFGWCHDPGEDGEEQIEPFIPWPKQVDLILLILMRIFSTIGTILKHNLLWEKTREIGASWIVVHISIWLAFFRNANVLIGADKAENTDKKGDLDTMFEKIRFVLKKIPPWVLPQGFHLKFDTTEMLIKNPAGGQIAGEAAGPDFGRSGRALVGFLDEFGTWDYAEQAETATAMTCRVRCFISTPKGPHNHFARMAKGDPEVPRVEKLRLHWTDDPIKRAGLRMLPDGGGWTSPWYEQVKAAMSADGLASEIDINYEASTKGKVFEKEFTEDHVWKGIIRLMPEPTGRILRVWDPGLHFYVLFMQIDQYQRVLALRELYLEQARIHDVAQEVLKISNEDFKGFTFEDCGDPAGAPRQNSAQEDPEYTILGDYYDINVEYYFMQEIQPQLRVKSRINAIRNKLREYCGAKSTLSVLVDPTHCPKLVEAFREGYRYKVDRRTKRVLEIIDEKHPSEDAIDCIGMGVLYKLGLGLQNTKPSQIKIAGATTWNRGIA